MSPKPASVLREDKCRANLEGLLALFERRLPPRSPASPELPVACDLPSTHTLDLSAIGAVLAAGGLLSMHQRDPSRVNREGDRFREVREYGLEFFVFSYHGIHQPYYAPHGEHLEAGRPVGVFIDLFSERGAVEQSNATFRDLAVSRNPPVFGPQTLAEWFLMPADAREACLDEICRRHGGDFWRYWGNPQAIGSDVERDNFVRNKWQEFYELHFRDRVPLANIGAILIPAYMMPSERGGPAISSRLAHAQLFSSLQDVAPQASLIFYPYDRLDPDGSFFAASFRVARMRVEMGVFPKSEELNNDTSGTK